MEHGAAPLPDPTPQPEPLPSTWEQARDAGISAWNCGDATTAEHWLLDALARAKGGEQLPGEPDSPRRLLVQSLIDLGCFYAAHGTAPVADRLLSEALRRIDSEPTFGRKCAAAAHVCNRLSELRCRPRGYPSAERLARRALDVRRRQSDIGPDHPDTARSVAALARSLLGQRKLDEAEALFKEAMAIYQRHPPAPQRDACGVLHGLADVCLLRGDAARALDLHEEALALRRRVLPPDHPDLLDSEARLAAACVRFGRQDKAIALCEHVLAAREKQFPGGDTRVGQALYDLAAACARPDPRRARDLLERALAIQEKNFGPEHPGVAGTLAKLADVLGRLDHWDRAVTLRQRIVRLREKELGEGHPAVIDAVTHVCHACCRAERWEDAEALDERALFLCEKHLGFDHPKVAVVLNHFAEVLRRRGHDARAASAAERAAQISRKHPETPGPGPAPGRDDVRRGEPPARHA